MWPLLFGTVPLNAWPPGNETEGITGQFAAARTAYRSGNVEGAQEIWRSIATDQSLESRHVLQAWSFLRGSGIEPPSPIDTQVLGVVVEVPVAGGRDVLAAYRDGSARYLNQAGGVAVIDVGAEAEVRAVVEAGQELAALIGPWDKVELPDLPKGHARLVLLAPSGFRFGQGPEAMLLNDPKAAPVFAAATSLLVKVVSLSP